MITGQRLDQKMSVILLCRPKSNHLRAVLKHLRAQTVSHLLELIIVTPSTEGLHLVGSELEGLSCQRIIELEENKGEGQAKALGVMAADASLVVFLEDHSLPDPMWAENLIMAHLNGNFAAVGPVVFNANPHSAVSWGCFLVFYGQWMSPTSEQVKHLPGNHSCYRKNLLLGYGNRLPDMLQAESLLHWDLVSRGHKLRQEPTAKCYHLNFTRLGDLLFEHFLASRLFAATRRHGWGSLRKMIYVLGSPLIPVIRLKRIFKESGKADIPLRMLLRAFFPMCLNLISGAAGESLGYAFGSARAGERLLRFEGKRDANVTAGNLEADVTSS